jgi:hypothetical protein
VKSPVFPIGKAPSHRTVGVGGARIAPKDNRPLPQGPISRQYLRLPYSRHIASYRRRRADTRYHARHEARQQHSEQCQTDPLYRRGPNPRSEEDWHNVQKLGGPDGVLVAAGGTVAGYTLYLRAEVQPLSTIGFNETRYKVTISERLQPGTKNHEALTARTHARESRIHDPFSTSGTHIAPKDNTALYQGPIFSRRLNLK